MDRTQGMYFAVFALALSSGLIECKTCSNILCKRQDISRVEDEIFKVKGAVEQMSLDLHDVRREIEKLSKVMDDLAKLINTIDAKLSNGDGVPAKNGPSTISSTPEESIASKFEDDWLVIAHRFDGTVSFHNRTWNEYKNGFGSSDGEFFLGFEAILSHLEGGNHMLRVDLVGWEGEHGIAEYPVFSIAEESKTYRLTISGYNALGPSSIKDMLKVHSGQAFSTIDRDNGENPGCPIEKRGPWWFRSKGCSANSNLFSVYPKRGGKCDTTWGCMYWLSFATRHYPKEMKMLIKPSL